jgi:hypothetical protein
VTSPRQVIRPYLPFGPDLPRVLTIALVHFERSETVAPNFAQQWDGGAALRVPPEHAEWAVANAGEFARPRRPEAAAPVVLRATLLGLMLAGIRCNSDRSLGSATGSAEALCGLPTSAVDARVELHGPR